MEDQPSRLGDHGRYSLTEKQRRVPQTGINSIRLKFSIFSLVAMTAVAAVCLGLYCRFYQKPLAEKASRNAIALLISENDVWVNVGVTGGSYEEIDLECGPIFAFPNKPEHKIIALIPTIRSVRPLCDETHVGVYLTKNQSSDLPFRKQLQESLPHCILFDENEHPGGWVKTRLLETGWIIRE